MTKIIAIGLLMFSAGCYTYGTSAMPSQTNNTGEGWFTKDTMALVFPVASEVYYCNGKGVCAKAIIK